MVSDGGLTTTIAPAAVRASIWNVHARRGDQGHDGCSHVPSGPTVASVLARTPSAAHQLDLGRRVGTHETCRPRGASGPTTRRGTGARPGGRSAPRSAPRGRRARRSPRTAPRPGRPASSDRAPRRSRPRAGPATRCADQRHHGRAADQDEPRGRWPGLSPMRRHQPARRRRARDRPAARTAGRPSRDRARGRPRHLARRSPAAGPA